MKVSQRPVLGKGLASLLPGATAAPSPVVAPPSAPTGAEAAGPATTLEQIVYGNRDRHPGISMATFDEIQANPYQPRREFDESALIELSQSITANGIIQPLVVRKNPQGGYYLIAGERRLRAAKLAGLKQVPIVVRRTTDREALEMALVENIQRQDLNCIDEALAYFQLAQEFSLTQEQVAERVGKERATVANHLRLLKLPEVIIDDLKNGTLTLGHGKALLSLEDSAMRLKARFEILDKKLSVRDTEALVDDMKTAASAPASSPAAPVAAGQGPSPSPLRQRMLSLAQELTRRWSAKVEMRGSERRGKIVFHYASRQELDRILEALQNHQV
jgi:ParB family chromosome partitioning protein